MVELDYLNFQGLSLPFRGKSSTEQRKKEKEKEKKKKKPIDHTN
jgi:hypothetical protein